MRPVVAAAAVVALLVPAVASTQETIDPGKVQDLSWEYVLSRQSLAIKACGAFRPGESAQCAEAEITDARTIEDAGRILRLPREKIGIVIEEAGKSFKIVGLSMQLLRGPGIAERSAGTNEVKLYGEALTEVSWTYTLATRDVRLRICGKLANPEYAGCADREIKGKGIPQLLAILLLEPVDKLVFNLGWDAAAKKFTKVRRISISAK